MGQLTYFLIMAPLHNSRTVETINFKFGMRIEPQRH